MGKMQRNKGAGFERQIVNELKVAGFAAARNLDQTRDGGGDIDLERYMFECKRRASIAVYDWLDQCTKAAKAGQMPIVIARGDRRETIAILRFSDLITILKEQETCADQSGLIPKQP